MIIQNRILYSLSIAVLLVGGALYFTGGYPQSADATLSETPFGGDITEVKYDCCNGHIVVVDDIVGGRSLDLLFSFASILGLYPEYQVYSSGAKALGNYQQGAQCVSIDEECESTENVDGEITIIGTSEI